MTHTSTPTDKQETTTDQPRCQASNETAVFARDSKPDGAMPSLPALLAESLRRLTTSGLSKGFKIKVFLRVLGNGVRDTWQLSGRFVRTEIGCSVSLTTRESVSGLFLEEVC